MKKVTALFLFIFATSLFAAGPETIAFSDRSLWPELINSIAHFDRASRAEILVFSAALTEAAEQNDLKLKSDLKIKKINRASIDKIRSKLMLHLLKNWKIAAETCSERDLLCPQIKNDREMVTAAKKLADNLPDSYRNWYSSAKNFHKNYANELIRLAALFPTITSEIDTLSTIESDGFELSDREFLLSFDDGPSNPQGNTDALLSLLASSNLHASFYMLGERLQARLKQSGSGSLVAMYQNQCASLHGWEHKSHAKWDKWQDSILSSRDLVKSTFPQQYRPWFRPPYGQRSLDSGDFFNKSGLRVALWNIDSQDWNSHISGNDAAQRVFTLMLLWRHGVILFHDVHPKAAIAIPWLLEHAKETGIIWKDCQTY